MKDHISVCICTFRRNEMLKRLLRKLKLQETGGLFDYSIIVVDNDKEGPAQETVMRLKEELALKIEYGIEQEKTIPAARNHALRLAQGNYIAIIDDDEFPPHKWLLTMYQAIRAFNVDGALGPVYPFFDKRPPTWLVKGRFCERPVYRTGTLLSWNQTRTGNVLLKKNVFEENQLKFDMNCRTSGSDRAFFKQAIKLGYKFIAVKEGPVYENVPPERWRRKYYLKRSLLLGYNAYRNMASDYRGLSRLIIPLRSIAIAIAYAVALPFSACLGSHILIKCLEKGAYHFSYLCALVGIELVKKRDS